MALTLEKQWEAIHTAKDLINCSDADLKAHAEFAVNNGRGEFKFAKWETQGIYAGSTLWVCDNSTFTVKPEYLQAQEAG